MAATRGIGGRGVGGDAELRRGGRSRAQRSDWRLRRSGEGEARNIGGAAERNETVEEMDSDSVSSTEGT